MARGNVAELARAARLGEVFTRAEAEGAGITRAQLRGPQVRTVMRGVFTTRADATSLDVRAEAAVKLSGAGALVCETTGLALLGVGLPDERLRETVHVWVPAGRHGPRMPGVRVHHDATSLRARRVRPGLWSVNPAECWRQAATALGVRDLVVLADGLMRRHDPLLYLPDLARTVNAMAGRRGARNARAALNLARERTDSPMETIIRLALVEAGLPCPEVDHVVPGVRGRPTYRLDMAYPQAMVAVEYDGAVHVSDVVQMRKDQTRRRRLEDLGWRLITATAVDAADPTSLVASVRDALARR